MRSPETTTLGGIVAASEPAEARDLSGVRLLVSGDDAFDSLIALADHAERTLDIQYYIIHEDDSARVILQHVRAAAGRGVRVRVLVDDLNTVGEDRRFMHLEQHANITVRVFNPFPGGRSAFWSRFLNSIDDIPRINHRMHNKLFIADNAIAITGGRNIGDEYFTRNRYTNFIDLDLVAAGPVVPQLSASFDAFWNSKYSYPIAALAPAPETEDAAASPSLGALESPAPADAPADAPVDAPADAPVDPAAGVLPLSEPSSQADPEWLRRELEAGRLTLDWVPATVVADRPAKIASDASLGEDTPTIHSIASLMGSAQKELVIISPYFVPGKGGVALIRELVERGVHIRILTNSLAATDSPLVQNGYARYRVALLKMGVDLREVRPLLGQHRARFHPFKSSHASLHAKALVIDERTVFIGSANIDPRSARLNSELGLVIKSPDIAHQVQSLLDDLTADGSYKLSLDDKGHIVWTSGEPGAEKVWHKEPETTLMQRVAPKLLAPFAAEELL